MKNYYAIPGKLKGLACRLSFIILPALCMAAKPLYAQQRSIDSLKRNLQQNDLSDSARIEILLQLGWDYTFVNIDSSREILYRCIRLASKTNNSAKTGEAYSYIGAGYYKTDDYDSALIYYQKAEGFFKKDTSADAPANLAANRMSMGTALLQRGDHQTALHQYLKAIDILEKAKDHNNLVTAYANIGLVYNDLKQYDKALFYHGKAMKICLAHKDKVDDAKTAQVQMFIAMDNLNLKHYDDARDALQRSDSLVKAIGSDYLSAIYYDMQGRYYHELKYHSRAIHAFGRSLDYAAKNNQQFQQENAFLHLGIIYFEQGDYKKSVGNLLSSIRISKKIGDKIRERKTLEYLSKAYTEIQDHRQAVTYYQQYIRLSDSLNESATKKKINEIENKYQAKKKQDSILVLQKTNQLQQLALHKKKNQNVFLITGLFLLLLIALLVYRNLRNRHRLLKQNELLQSRRISELEKERQLVAAHAVMKGQEQERSRLARDLHDGVGGLLSGVKLSLSTMKGNVFLSEVNAEAFNNILTRLDESIGELRRVSHNMMPEALIKYGLKEALENYCENLNLSGEIKVQLQAYGMEQRMEQNTEIVLYRIVQELLNNAIKHAAAKNVLIQLMREEDRFSLTVEDDGKGFDIREAEKKNGAGLANIKARVDYLGGTVDFRSAPGEGASVNIIGKCQTEPKAES